MTRSDVQAAHDVRVRHVHARQRTVTAPHPPHNAHAQLLFLFEHRTVSTRHFFAASSLACAYLLLHRFLMFIRSGCFLSLLICMYTSHLHSTYLPTSTCHNCTNAFQVVPQNRVALDMVVVERRHQWKRSKNSEGMRFSSN